MHRETICLSFHCTATCTEFDCSDCAAVFLSSVARAAGPTVSPDSDFQSRPGQSPVWVRLHRPSDCPAAAGRRRHRHRRPPPHQE